MAGLVDRYWSVFCYTPSCNRLPVPSQAKPKTEPLLVLVRAILVIFSTHCDQYGFYQAFPSFFRIGAGGGYFIASLAFWRISNALLIHMYLTYIRVIFTSFLRFSDSRVIVSEFWVDFEAWEIWRSKNVLAVEAQEIQWRLKNPSHVINQTPNFLVAVKPLLSSSRWCCPGTFFHTFHIRF